MRRFFWIIILICPVLASCHRQNPYPELNDPIYEDLFHSLQAKTHDLAEAKKKLAAIKKELVATRPRTIDRANDKLLLKKEQVIYQRLLQTVAYDKIRTKRRQIDDRVSYKLAFLQGKPWPNPKEYQRYLLSKKMSHSVHNWDHPNNKQ